MFSLRKITHLMSEDNQLNPKVVLHLHRRKGRDEGICRSSLPKKLLRRQ